MRHAIKIVNALLLLVGLLGGCKSTETASLHAIQPQKDYTEREVAQAARAGHRLDLGLDAFQSGQLDDKDYLEVNAQLHNAVLSANRASAAVKAMREAEKGDRIAKGLKEAPMPEMTETQKAQRLGDLRRALADVRAYEAEIESRKREGGAP